MLKIAARDEYACKAVIELALAWPDETPLGLHFISERQRIPRKFLPHIMMQLRQHGLVRSLRGKRGGYLLAVSPSSITLADILRTSEIPPGASFGKRSTRDGFWIEMLEAAERRLWETFASRTIAELASEQRSQREALTYEI